MATVLSPPTPRVILRNISWETYARLLAEHEETSSTHFTYDRGLLEIMVLSAKHEAIKHTLALIVEVVAEEWELDVYGVGSTTFRREDLARGFEPDACFYLQQAAQMRGKEDIDPALDPPPDLVIAVDIPHPSLDKFPIFAALRLPEVWRYDGTHVAIATLAAYDYRTVSASCALPGVTSTVLEQFLDASMQMPRPAWLRYVREWVRTQRLAGRESPTEASGP